MITGLYLELAIAVARAASTLSIAGITEGSEGVSEENLSVTSLKI